MNLAEAAQNGDLEECINLLEHRTNARIDDALQQATIRGYFEICKLLIKHGANIHTSSDYPLRWASRNGHLEVCKLLLEHGANVHAIYDWPLRWAAKNEHFEVCKLLIGHGADVHADNDLALRWAARNGHIEACKLLLEHGASLRVLFTAEGNPQKIVHKFATKEQIEQAKKEWEVQKVMDS